jgi:hypothetical protein
MAAPPGLSVLFLLLLLLLILFLILIFILIFLWGQILGQLFSARSRFIRQLKIDGPLLRFRNHR